MQSLHQSIIRILSSFWTYELLELNKKIEKLTCREFHRNRNADYKFIYWFIYCVIIGYEKKTAEWQLFKKNMVAIRLP